jgi:hypothetical protein
MTSRLNAESASTETSILVEVDELLHPADNMPSANRQPRNPIPNGLVEDLLISSTSSTADDHKSGRDE